MNTGGNNILMGTFSPNSDDTPITLKPSSGGA